VRRYADHIGLRYTGMNDNLEETLRKNFKPLKSNHLEITPCTIADRHGQVLLWYLPNILRQERQVRLKIERFILINMEVNVGINVYRPQNVRTGTKV
jgi:hypothetical protein